MNNQTKKVVAGFFALAGLTSVSGALAHEERPAFFPQNRVQHYPAHRPLGTEAPRLVVCKRPGDEGIGEGEDSASRIARMQDETVRASNRRLLGECRFEHIQAAVNAVTQRGSNIYVLPGVYREEPSIRARYENAGAANPADTAFCQAVLALGQDNLTYEQQFRCPHIQNTVAIFGDRNYSDDNCGPEDTAGDCDNPETVVCNPAVSGCPFNDLQLEGTGEKVTDVILTGRFIDAPGTAEDGQFEYLNGIRLDRADNIYIRGITAQIFEFNAIYALEVDGYVFERVLARWNDEYGFLSFAADHGLYTEHESYGNADSGPYPGSAANLFEVLGHAGVNQQQRQSAEMRNGRSHHNGLGYSGTAGNSVWVHDNHFYKNQTGFVTDSFVPGHPGHPQDHDLIENNRFYSNNKDYTRHVAFDGPCNTLPPRDRGLVPGDPFTFDAQPPEVQEALLDTMVVCPPFPGSIGTGIMIAGGNYNTVRNNFFFDNWKHGVMLFHIPAAVREEPDPAKAYDNSHYNRFLTNQLALNPFTGALQPNGVDFWFDDSGVGNCWDGNVSAAGAVTEDTGNPLGLPGAPCPDDLPPDAAEQQASQNNARIAFLAACAAYNREDPATKTNCEFLIPPDAPAGRADTAVAMASQPVRADAVGGETERSGYFVLNNDTSLPHSVNAVTIAAEGPAEYLSGLVVTVNGESASVSGVGGSNVLTFASPVEVLAGHMVLFELTASARDYLAAAPAPKGMLLASGAGSAVFGLALLAGAPRRRRAAVLIALAIVAAGALSSCGKSPPVGGGAISFKLTAMDVSDDNGAVNYGGLPLQIGTIELH